MRRRNGVCYNWLDKFEQMQFESAILSSTACDAIMASWQTWKYQHRGDEASDSIARQGRTSFLNKFSGQLPGDSPKRKTFETLQILYLHRAICDIFHCSRKQHVWNSKATVGLSMMELTFRVVAPSHPTRIWNMTRSRSGIKWTESIILMSLFALLWGRRLLSSGGSRPPARLFTSYPTFTHTHTHTHIDVQWAQKSFTGKETKNVEIPGCAVVGRRNQSNVSA